MKNTQNDILEAAKDLFSQKGYVAVRTKEIAKKAGVNESTLFRYYKSKKILFESIIAENMKVMDKEVLFHNQLVGDVEKDLLMITSQMFLIYQSNAQIIKMIMKSIIEDTDGLDRKAEECRGGHIRKYLLMHFAEMKNKGTISDDPKVFIDLYLNCMNGYLLNSFIFEDKDADLEQLKQMTLKLIDLIK